VNKKETRMQKQARLIAVTHPKGGVGKTSTSMVLAAELAERGYRVLVADCDAQASASAWANAAPEGKPFPAAVVNLAAYAGKVHREIQKQLENYDFIIVDCPPGLDSLSPQSAILIADLVIVPTPPSPADVWACLGAIRLIERGADLNPALIALMSSRLTNRTAYQEAVVSGVSISALGRGAKPAADEVRALADEVLALLGE
jgi:chromosome partitioning protein